MAARRCSLCGINYGLDVGRCPSCGRETWHSESSTPGSPSLDNEEYELRGDTLRLYDAEADARIVDWRARCFEALGFSSIEASLLSTRRDVDREDVERMILAGATTAQVRGIVL